MLIQKMLATENDTRVTDLRHRMDEFYSSITDYSDFQEPNFKPEFWKPVREAKKKFFCVNLFAASLSLGQEKLDSQNTLQIYVHKLCSMCRI